MRRWSRVAAIVAGLFLVTLIVLRLSHPRVELLSDTTPAAHGASRELIVVMHGLKGAKVGLRDVVDAIARTHPDADLLVPRFDVGLFSNADPAALSAHLDQVIQRAVDERARRAGGGYERIVLVGQSAGALLVRKAYVFGRGSREDAPGGPTASPGPRSWPRLVTRVVLLAGINRGWTLTPRPPERPLWMQLGFRTLDALAGVAGVGGFLDALERGSPFVGNLRVQWIRLLQDAREPLPAVYQLLGREDGIVTRDDSQDLVGMPAYATLVVLGTRHGEIALFDDSPAGRDRREKFEQALLLPELELAQAYAPQDTASIAAQPAAPVALATPPPAGDSASTPAMRGGTVAFARPTAARARATESRGAERTLTPQGAALRVTPSRILASRVLPRTFSVPTRMRADSVRHELRVELQSPLARGSGIATAREWNLTSQRQAQPRKHVVFVLHGIRDNGDFAIEIARLIQERSGESRDSIEVVTDRYDRFGMLPFLLSGARQRQVRWFMDRYTEQLARSPGATFSFIGHSNGTYVLASALDRYATMRMGNVVFAGSVVPRGFPWERLASSTPPRVARLLNVRAAGDIVVAVFPRFYEFIYEHLRLGWFGDIGSAGFSGFKDTFANRDEIAFVKGGHGAALRPRNAALLVDYALTGTCDAAAFDRQPRADGLVELASGLCGLLWFLILAALVAGGWWVWTRKSTGVRVALASVYVVTLLLVLYNI